MKRGLVVLVSGALAAPLAAQDASHTASAVERGQAMFDLICSACHSWDPPAKLAPPMSMVLGHYLERYADTDEASDAIAAWISGPDAERSVLPSHAVQQFGLMPGQPLPEAERRAVAAYLLDRAAREGVGIGMGRRAQADPPAPADGMQGMQHGQGMQGMQRGQGMQGMQRGQGMQGMQHGQGMQGMQHGQGMQGMQRGQGMQGMQHGQGMQGMQRGQGMQGMQRGQGMQGGMCSRMEQPARPDTTDGPGGR